MKADNTRTDHNRTIRFTEIPDVKGTTVLRTLDVTVNYTTQSDGAVIDKAVTLDNAVIPEIIARFKPLWIILYHHRHGTDTYPVYQDEEPSESEVIKFLDTVTEYEGPRPEDCQGDDYDEEDVREDESIEVRGPF